jgi:hypothetical protein
MFRRERYFDKNDRPQNMYGKKKEYIDKTTEDEDDEITLVIEKDREGKNQDESS